MGRLSGFRYRQIIKKLKAFGFEFLRHAAGITRQLAGLQQPRIILATCPNEHCERY